MKFGVQLNNTIARSLQGRPHRTSRAGVLDNEVHPETLNTLLIALQPVHRTTQEAALAARIGRSEHRGTSVQRLPIRQTRTHILDIGRVPPLLTSLRIVSSRIDHTTCIHLLHEGHTKGAFPDLVNQIHVAFTHRRVHQRRIR